jgi:hypothetical protein
MIIGCPGRGMMVFSRMSWRRVLLTVMMVTILTSLRLPSPVMQVLQVQAQPQPKPVAQPARPPTFQPTAPPSTFVYNTITNQKGTISGSVTAAFQQYVWIVSPANPSASTIQMVFTSFSILQAEFYIRDGTSSTSTILLACSSCGSLVSVCMWEFWCCCFFMFRNGSVRSRAYMFCLVGPTTHIFNHWQSLH